MITLCIQNENLGWSRTMTLGDISNNQHSFEWSEQHGRYCYEPKSQAEADDILATNYAFAKVVWKVGVIFDGALNTPKTASNPSAVSTLRIPPYVDSKHYDKPDYTISDLQLLASDQNLELRGDPENRESVINQLRAHFNGKAWAVEEKNRLTAKVSQLEREKAISTPVVESVVVVTPVEAQTPAESLTTAKDSVIVPPVKAKRGRPRKIQELQPA